MRKFYANSRERIVWYVFAGIFAVLAIAMGILWLTDKDSDTLFPLSLGAALICFVVGLLRSAKKVYLNGIEIRLVSIRKKAAYKRSDLREIYIDYTRYGSLRSSIPVSDFHMVLCFYEYSGIITVRDDFSVDDYEKQCKLNPKIKFHKIEYTKILLAELRKDPSIRIICAEWMRKKV